MTVRHIEYKVVLSPSVDYLRNAGTLFLDVPQMAEFLGLPAKIVYRLSGTDRLPMPRCFRLGKCLRWSVLELADWVEAGCPRRRRWMELQRQIGRW